MNSLPLNCFNHECISIDTSGNITINCFGHFYIDNNEYIVLEEGSSMTLSYTAFNTSFNEWEFYKNSTPEFILQNYADHPDPTIYSAYSSRTRYNRTTNSITISRLNAKDTGIYKATNDLEQKNAKRFRVIILSHINAENFTRKFDQENSIIMKIKAHTDDTVYIVVIGLLLTLNIITIMCLLYSVVHHRGSISKYRRADVMFT